MRYNLTLQVPGHSKHTKLALYFALVQKGRYSSARATFDSHVPHSPISRAISGSLQFGPPAIKCTPCSFQA